MISGKKGTDTHSGKILSLKGRKYEEIDRFQISK